MTSNYPHVVKPCFLERDDLKKQQPSIKYVYIGLRGYMLPEYFLKHAADIYNMPIRSTDIFVNSFPRSGTTWTMELTWLVANDLDFETAKSTEHYKRFPHLEHYMWTEYNTVHETSTLPFLTHAFEGPTRFIKTHLPLSLLPANTVDTAKVIYVARDPRDVAVSYHHFVKDIASQGKTFQLKEGFESYMTQNKIPYGPIFEHVKEAWAQRHHPNMLFIFYEELCKDLKGTAKRVAKFLNKEYSDVQLDQLCDHLKFENFQKNSADVAIPQVKRYQDKYFKYIDAKSFIRKGKIGGWREYFDEELTLKAQRWMEENLRDTDLRYPCQDF